MKKIFLVSLFSICAMLAIAQTPAPVPAPTPVPTPAPTTDDTLQHYVGTYKFPEGSVVPEVTVLLDSGKLVITSQMGNSDLIKISTDLYELIAYNGTTAFKRNAERKVNAIRIEVGDTILEGNKVEK